MKMFGAAAVSRDVFSRQWAFWVFNQKWDTFVTRGVQRSVALASSRYSADVLVTLEAIIGLAVLVGSADPVMKDILSRLLKAITRSHDGRARRSWCVSRRAAMTPPWPRMGWRPVVLSTSRHFPLTQYIGV